VLYLDGWKAFSLVLVDSKKASFLSLYLPARGEQTLLLISQPDVQPVLYLDGWKAFSLVLVDSKMARFAFCPCALQPR
jgi:hypothetical protein